MIFGEQGGRSIVESSSEDGTKEEREKQRFVVWHNVTSFAEQLDRWQEVNEEEFIAEKQGDEEAAFFGTESDHEGSGKLWLKCFYGCQQQLFHVVGKFGLRR